MSPEQTRPFTIHLLSFGHKHGPPDGADLVFDARVLPNPYWDKALRAFPGTEPQIAAYVLDKEEGRQYLKVLLPFVDFVVSRHRENGKKAVTIAVGCTGGRHRSVSVTEALRQHLNTGNLTVTVSHRDIDRDEHP